MSIEVQILQKEQASTVNVLVILMHSSVEQWSLKPKDSTIVKNKIIYVKNLSITNFVTILRWTQRKSNS